MFALGVNHAFIYLYWDVYKDEKKLKDLIASTTGILFILQIIFVSLGLLLGEQVIKLVVKSNDLFTYSPGLKAPPGCLIREAEQILPRSDIIHYKDVAGPSSIALFTTRLMGAAVTFLQLGFGFAYLSDDKFESDGSPRYRFNGDLVYDDGTSDMGSHGQFESSIALGLVKDSFSIRAKVYHYSNANVTSDNGGMDVAEFGVSYRF